MQKIFLFNLHFFIISSCYFHNYLLNVREKKESVLDAYLVDCKCHFLNIRYFLILKYFAGILGVRFLISDVKNQDSQR